MKASRIILSGITVFLCALGADAQGDSSRQLVSVQIDGTQRSAILFQEAPVRGVRSPLVLVFHGYGGNANGISKRLPIHKAWPRAIVVYPQGLVIPERNDGRVKQGTERPGWQRAPGKDDDRDLRYVDTLIKEVSSLHRVNPEEIYAAGYSNGAVFTWALLKARPNTFAGFAPIAGVDNGNIQKASVSRPVIFHFGARDEAFELAWAEKSLRRVKRLNGSRGDGEPWGYRSLRFDHDTSGAPVVWHLHPRGHEVPPYAARNIAQFFREVEEDK